MFHESDMQTLYVRAFRSSLFGALIMAALLLLLAGTLDYWQAWIFMAVFVSASGAVTAYLAIHDPRLLERRMHGGPAAERERSQKFIMFLPWPDLSGSWLSQRSITGLAGLACRLTYVCLEMPSLQ